jgi:hypothetical protein
VDLIVSASDTAPTPTDVAIVQALLSSSRMSWDDSCWCVATPTVHDQRHFMQREEQRFKRTLPSALNRNHN